MKSSVLLPVTFATLAQSESECPNPGLSYCNLNLHLEDRTGPVCEIVEFEGCEENFGHLTAEQWAEFYTTIECYCEQPEIQQFLKTAALPAVIVFDQISNEYQHDYSIASRRNLGWGWKQWLGFAVKTIFSIGTIVYKVYYGGRRTMSTTQAVTFNFNEVFHTCNAIDVPTSFCNQLMSDNAFEFSQICGSDLSCDHDFDSLMQIMETAQSTTLHQIESHEDCPDLGLGFCLLHNILDGKFGPVCDNLPDWYDECEDKFTGMNAEDFNSMYEANNMDCFCSREEVQTELQQAHIDVLLFDMVIASSHVALPARRALDGWGWEDWMAAIVNVSIAIAGKLLLGRRNMASASTLHFDWENIVQVCSQYPAFDMCEMPANLNVKQFEFLCLGEAECEVSAKDLNKLFKYNHFKQITDGF